MKMNSGDLMGIHEVAEFANVSRQAVCNWRTRLVDFPEPLVVLACSPVFDGMQILEWLVRRSGTNALDQISY